MRIFSKLLFGRHKGRKMKNLLSDKSMSVIVQEGATIHSLFISVKRSTCFGQYLRPSAGAHVSLSTASGTGQTVLATCRYRGEDGTPTPPR